MPLFNNPPYYITAYGLAVKRGYKGTIDEWLASLRGDPGPGVKLRYNAESGWVEWAAVDTEDWQELFALEELADDVNAAMKAQLDAAVAEAAGSAQSAAAAAADALGSEGKAYTASQQANKYAYEANGSAQSAAAAQEVAENAAQEAAQRKQETRVYLDGAEQSAGAAEDAARQAKEAAEAAAKRAEDADGAAADALGYAEDAETQAVTAARAVEEAGNAAAQAVAAEQSANRAYEEADRLVKSAAALEESASRYANDAYNSAEEAKAAAKRAEDVLNSGQNTKPETLDLVYSTSYPDPITFEYTEKNSSSSTLIFKESTTPGGILSFDFDTATITKFEVILYLFKNGQPYKYTQNSTFGVNFNGQMYPVWNDPGVGSGFNRVTGPFTVEIPDDCTIMACIRFQINNGILPDGSEYSFNPDSSNWIGFWAMGGGVKCAVVRNADGSGNGSTSAVNYANQNVRAINHRGYNTIAPENTLSAFKLSKKNGFEYVECDVLLTSDGVPVLLHDTTVDRTSNGTGNLSDMTLEQVRALDFGSWKSTEYAGEKIPTFEEFILLCKNIGLHPYIELKQTITFTQEQVNQLVQTVNRNGMRGKVTYISMSHVYLDYFKNADPKARLGYVVGDVTGTVISNAELLKTDTNEVFIDAGIGYITADGYTNAINSGFPLEMWTVNAAQILELDPYVTGFTSDDARAEVILYDANMN